MEIKSIGLSTNVTLNSIDGYVTFHDGYIIVRTPSRLDYIWGNYIIIVSPLKKIFL